MSHLLIKVTAHLPYDPTIARLGIYPNETKTEVHSKACMGMFPVASFIIAQLEMTLMGFSCEWTSTRWHPQNGTPLGDLSA